MEPHSPEKIMCVKRHKICKSAQDWDANSSGKWTLDKDTVYTKGALILGLPALLLKHQVKGGVGLTVVE